MKNKMETLTEKELATQIKFALNDLFLAQIEQEDTTLTLKFASGKHFRLCISQK